MKLLSVLTASVAALAVGAAPAIAEPVTNPDQVEVVELDGPAITAADIENMVDVDTRGIDDEGDVGINIVGGTAAPAGAYPWMAKLLVKKSNGRTSGCGGMIVSKNIVLTAQHCVSYRRDKVETVEIRYGNVNWKQGKKATTKSFATGDGMKRGDWAVLKFDQPLDIDTFPTVANHAGHNNGPTFKSAGWGKVSEKGKSTKQLREVSLPFISDQVCGANSNEICAGDWERGGIDTCQGDSGGPLFNNAAGTPVIVGIVSWGKGCARPKNPGHYTEISTYWNAIGAAVDRLGGDRPADAPRALQAIPNQPVKLGHNLMAF